MVLLAPVCGELTNDRVRVPVQGSWNPFSGGSPFQQKQARRTHRKSSPPVEEQAGNDSENLTPELLKKLTDPSRNLHSRRAATPGGENDRRVRRGSLSGN